MCRIGLFIAIAITVAGCEEKKEPRRVMSGENAAEEIRGAFADNVGVVLSSLECPEELVVEVGKQFECTAKMGDLTFPIEVTHRTLDGKLDWTPKPTVIPTNQIGMLAAGILERFAPEAEGIHCGDAALLLSTPGEVYRCDIPGRDDLWIEVHIEDELGNMRVIPAGPAAP